MSETTTKEVKKEVKTKGSTSTGKVELVVGAGANALKAAVKNAEKVLDQVKLAAVEAENITNEVATKKAELDNLATEYAEKTRQAEVDVALRVQEKKGEAIKQFLGELGQEAVNSVDYSALKSDNQNMKTNFDVEVGKAKTVAEQVAKASYEQQKKIDEATAKMTAAQKDADLTAANSQVTFYKGEVDNLRKQLTEERDARVKEAQARGVSAVTVNTTGQR